MDTPICEGSRPAPPPITVHCWSGPRCVSTALMYSFRQRSDTKVVDEPLYASYLARTGAERPYRDLVLNAQSTSAAEVIQSLNEPHAGKFSFAKHMAKHRLDIPLTAFGPASKHMLLVRHPLAVIRSFSKVLPATLEETCYPALLSLASELRTSSRHGVPIILSEDLVRDAEGTLSLLCCALGMAPDPAMLDWEVGPKPEDGPWAPWWYAGSHASTGFGKGGGGPGASAVKGRTPLDPTLRPLLEECQALYAVLSRRALRPHSARPGGGLLSLDSGACPVHRGGTHEYAPDSRNDDTLVGMRDGVTGSFDLVWRPAATVSVLESGFLLGDGVWEGLRLLNGVVLFADRHLARLFEGAAGIGMSIGMTPEQLLRLVYATVDANAMQTGVHIRLMVTRGLKPTPYQNPKTTIGLPTIVIIPEYKEAAPGPQEDGISLFTCHVRRGPPDVQDPGWNSHSKLNCISACIQASAAGADEALMLDPHGFVATCNSTNFFIIRSHIDIRGERQCQVWAPTPRYQMPGITRASVLGLCEQEGIPCRELDFTVTQVYGADEAFVTGTFGGLTPVVRVDGRRIGRGSPGPTTLRLQAAYAALCLSEAERGRVRTLHVACSEW
ncbi:hypothetical protein ACKKBF_B09750 [Auxenochlorella protothecoides x Auxenochlorella symbiontica]